MGSWGAANEIREVASVQGRRATTEGVRWRRLFSRGFLLASLVAGSAALISLPELEEAGPRPPVARLIPDPDDRIEAVAFAPDGETVVSCGTSSEIAIWSLANLERGQVLDAGSIQDDRGRLAAAYSPDGKRLAVSGLGAISVWSIQNGRFRRTLRIVGPTAHSLAFSPDSKLLALGGEDGVVRVIDPGTGVLVHQLRQHRDTVRTVAFGPRGDRLLSSGQDRSVILWDLESGKPIRNLAQQGSSAVEHAAFSPDGKTIAVGDMSGSPEDVLVLDAETGRIQARLTGNAYGVLALAYSPDGRTLAAAGGDRTIRLWDLATNRLCHRLGEHVGIVTSLAFSPDGSRLVFGGKGATIGIWDLTRPLLFLVDSRTRAESAFHLTLIAPSGGWLVKPVS